MEDYLLNLPPEILQQLYAEASLSAQCSCIATRTLHQPMQKLDAKKRPLRKPLLLSRNTVVRGTQASKNGMYPVLVYEIPNSDRCYIFQRLKKTSREETVIYRCSGCKTQNGKYPSVFVTGEEVFESDPCALSHNCLPLQRHKDKARRVAYGALRKDKTAHKTPIRKHYNNAAQSILEMPWKDYDNRMRVLTNFVGASYQEQRRTFAKASAAQKRTVELDNIPDDIALLPNGGNFVHVQRSDLHIYYSEEVISKAMANGLYVLIGDGVHKLNPKTIPDRMDKGQLYIVHAVIRGGFEVPILYAITRRKTVATYKAIFRQLKDIIGAGEELRIILDFEKAAIRAARETFTNARVKGCAFHLARAWNRMAKELGLMRFIKGPKQIRAVARRWRILKGIVFLPQELMSRVTALSFPPVNERSVAYTPSLNFLKYLQDTWFSGPFKDMWGKWNVDDFRTSNAAEALGNYCTLRELTSQRVLDVSANESERAGQNPRATKPLRRRDLQRREKINSAMDEFRLEWGSRSSQDITTIAINDYCKTMSRYVTEKTL